MYYLTHDKAGRQNFLLTKDESLTNIEEEIEQSAIAYIPETGKVYIRLGEEWIEAVIPGGSSSDVLKALEDGLKGQIPILNENGKIVGWKDFVDYDENIKYKLHITNSDGNFLLGWRSGNYVYLYENDTEYPENARLDIVYENEKWYLKSLVDSSRQLQVNVQNSYAAFYASSQLNGWSILDETGAEKTTLPIDETFYLITTNNSKWFALTNNKVGGTSYRMGCFQANSKDDLLDEILDDEKYEFTVSEVIIGSSSEDIYAEKSEVVGKPGTGVNAAIFGTGSASGNNSVSIGTGTSVTAEGGIAVGRFNSPDSSKLIIVGNGNAGSPNNSFTVGTSGNVYSANKIEAELDVIGNGVSLSDLSDTVDGIWYGDKYNKVFEQINVVFVSNNATLNSFPFTEPGTYRFRIGEDIYTDTVTQEQIDDEQVYFSGILNINGTRIEDDFVRDGTFYVSSELITTKKVPAKYIESEPLLPLIVDYGSAGAYAKISQALARGQMVYCKRTVEGSAHYLPYTYTGALHMHNFSLIEDGTSYKATVGTSNNWSAPVGDIVTTISSRSTHRQIPTAKSVYDYVANTTGNNMVIEGDNGSSYHIRIDEDGNLYTEEIL